tara:strand:+ start:162 stop:365 length:204 start_codon:yes stop_codon:yes gene_type:complete
MKDKFKTVIVFGNTENEKLILINKLLKDGFRLKSCTGNIYDELGLYWKDEKNSSVKIVQENFTTRAG